MLREEPHNSQGKISLSPQVILSVDEIRKAVENCNSFSNVNYIQTSYARMKLEKIDFESFKDLDIVEIGSGYEPFNTLIPCKSYTGVDPYAGGGENGILKIDGLSYLRTLLDKSAVVVSFGVIDFDILSKMYSKMDLQMAYIEELKSEIIRVSSPFSILIGADVERFFGKPDIDLGVELTGVRGGVYNFN